MADLITPDLVDLELSATERGQKHPFSLNGRARRKVVDRRQARSQRAVAGPGLRDQRALPDRRQHH